MAGYTKKAIRIIETLLDEKATLLSENQRLAAELVNEKTCGRITICTATYPIVTADAHTITFGHSIVSDTSMIAGGTACASDQMPDFVVTGGSNGFVY